LADVGKRDFDNAAGRQGAAGGQGASDMHDGEPAEERLEPAVIAALYVEHAAELLRFLTGILRDAQLASDALQSAFVRMVEVGHRTQDGSRKAWLFRVAYNEAMAVRRRQTTGEKVVRRTAWGKTLTADAADEVALKLESIEAVRQALATLPANEQEVVRMRIYDDKKFADIAEELHIPLGTALGRMRNALKRLRKALDE